MQFLKQIQNQWDSPPIVYAISYLTISVLSAAHLYWGQKRCSLDPAPWDRKHSQKLRVRWVHKVLCFFYQHTQPIASRLSATYNNVETRFQQSYLCSFLQRCNSWFQLPFRPSPPPHPILYYYFEDFFICQKDYSTQLKHSRILGHSKIHSKTNVTCKRYCRSSVKLTL